MRLLELVVFIYLQSFLIFSFSGGLKSCSLLYSKKMEVKNAFDSERFISESFRNACEGRGFASFVEWQKVCKDMWELDYIAWTEADTFMEIEKPEKGKLMYGRWTGPYGAGEVYCRVR